MVIISKIKTVSLIYTYGLRNCGDIAINLGALDILLSMGLKIKLFSRFDKNHPEYSENEKYLKSIYPDIQYFEGPFKLNRKQNIFKRNMDNFQGLLTITGIRKDNKFIENFIDSDLVVFNGGNLFRSKIIADYLRLIGLMYPLKIASDYNIPYIIFPQSAYKIDFIGEVILKKYIKKCKHIWSRELLSYNYLKQKFNISNISQTLDLAFYISKNKMMNQKELEQYDFILNKKQSKIIAITLRCETIGDLKKFNKYKIDKIFSVISNTINYLILKNYEIVFVIQTYKDRNTTYEFCKKYKVNNKIKIIEENNPVVLKKLYRNVDILIGMRLHSIILALSSGVPAIGYFDKDWGFKNPGLMEEFNLPYKFIEDDIENLIEDVKYIINNMEILKDKINKKIEKDKKIFLKELNQVFNEI